MWAELSMRMPTLKIDRADADGQIDSGEFDDAAAEPPQLLPGEG